jgi:hypothetical protein
LPSVVYRGGGVVATPQIVTVTFAGDPLASDLATFGSSLVSSSWWEALQSDCPAGTCVGAGQATSVAIPTPAAATYTDSAGGNGSTLQQWVSATLTAGGLPAPSGGAISNSVYVLYLPQTTTVSFDGAQSCSSASPNGYDGYHNSMSVGQQRVSYAVVVECPPQPPQFSNVAPTTLLESVTLSASHEIAEAVTDPLPVTGYALDDAHVENLPWIDVTGGGELGDLCVDLLGLNQDRSSQDGLSLQRIWSIPRSAAGLEPCNPVPSGDTSFNVAPRRAFFALDVGTSATFSVDAFSYRPMADWTLAAVDASGSTDTYLTFAIAGGKPTPMGPAVQIHAGAAVEVTVTLAKDPSSLATRRADGLLVSFSGAPSTPSAAHFWPIAVTTSAGDAGGGTGTMRRGGSTHRPHMLAWQVAALQK